MGIDDFSGGGEKVVEKFEQLRTKAVEEFVESLMREGESSYDHARVRAVDEFDDAYTRATDVYYSIMRENVSDAASTNEERLEEARELLQELETTFRESGLSERLSKRLAAILPDMEDLAGDSLNNL